MHSEMRGEPYISCVNVVDDQRKFDWKLMIYDTVFKLTVTRAITYEIVYFVKCVLK